MTDAKTVKTPKKAAAVNPAPEHPSYIDMVKKAIEAGDSRKGSTRVQILKYIVSNYKVKDTEKAAMLVRRCLKTNLEKGVLKKAREAGKGSGGFKVAKEDKPKKVVKKVPAVPRKPVSSAAKSTAKASARKSTGAVSAKPKKTAKKPTAKTGKDAKKTTSKTPASKKTAAKTAKSPAAKKAVAKVSAKSPAAKKVKAKKVVPTKSPKPKSTKAAPKKK